MEKINVIYNLKKSLLNNKVKRLNDKISRLNDYIPVYVSQNEKKLETKVSNFEKQLNRQNTSLIKKVNIKEIFDKKHSDELEKNKEKLYWNLRVIDNKLQKHLNTRIQLNRQLEFIDYLKLVFIKISHDSNILKESENIESDVNIEDLTKLEKSFKKKVTSEKNRQLKKLGSITKSYNVRPREYQDQLNDVKSRYELLTHLLVYISEFSKNKKIKVEHNSIKEGFILEQYFDNKIQYLNKKEVEIKELISKLKDDNLAKEENISELKVLFEQNEEKIKEIDSKYTDEKFDIYLTKVKYYKDRDNIDFAKMQNQYKEDLLKKEKDDILEIDEKRKTLTDKNITKEKLIRQNSENKVNIINNKLENLKKQSETFYKQEEEMLVKNIQNLKEKLNNKDIKEEQKIKISSEISDLENINKLYKSDNNVCLSIQSLLMQFGGLKAVDNLSFDVKKGEIFGLIGPNGAGKTTVFNCITQFYKSTGGQIYLKNKQNTVINLREVKVYDIVKHGIVRTFQNVELIWELSILDNLLVAAHTAYKSSFLTQLLHLPGLKREEEVIKAKAMQVLKEFELDKYASIPPIGLPYGILKRIELARTLMLNPEIIILDEPAAGLNETETKELAKLIRDIRTKHNVTIFLIEHDMGLVMNLCDRICAISFGKLLGIGTPLEIQANKDVQEAYLGGSNE